MAQPVRQAEGAIGLIGHSFGGILAQEIARQISIKKILLISSIKSRKELPLFFRSVGYLGLQRMFTKEITLKSFPFWSRQHGYASEELQELFVSMVAQHSNHYLKWALKQLSVWAPKALSETPLLHLHGDQDKTFPVHLIQEPVKVVKGGTHLLVYDRAPEVNQWILEALSHYHQDR